MALRDYKLQRDVSSACPGPNALLRRVGLQTTKHWKQRKKAVDYKLQQLTNTEKRVPGRLCSRRLHFCSKITSDVVGGVKHILKYQVQ